MIKLIYEGEWTLTCAGRGPARPGT